MFFCLALFLITLLSCNKEVEIAQSVATFELYSPEQHEMNQNGLFFIERSFDFNQRSFMRFCPKKFIGLCITASHKQ